MQRTLSYIAIIIVILANNLSVFAEEQDEKVDSIPLWNGFRVELDIASPLFSAMGMSESYNTEGGIYFNLKRKYFPLFEMGVAGLNNKISPEAAVFSTNGMFFRAGMDLNLLKTSKDNSFSNNAFLVGFRLGTSSFSYDLTNVLVNDNYWGGSEIRNYENVHANKWWYEVVVGMRVEVFKNVLLGWNVRNKHLFKAEKGGSVYPYFTPGFGFTHSANWAFNYTVGYKF